MEKQLCTRKPHRTASEYALHCAPAFSHNHVRPKTPCRSRLIHSEHHLVRDKTTTTVTLPATTGIVM